jgi:transcriptional regulator with XRE-family HTH domain
MKYTPPLGSVDEKISLHCDRVKSALALRLQQRLRFLRQQKGLTQEQVAERAGVSYKFYQGVEAGRRPNVGLFTLEKLSKALGVEASELISTKSPKGS